MHFPLIDQTDRTVLQKAHSPLKANVYLEELEGQQRVVKDYSDSPGWLRSTVCRFMLNREVRTLKKLSGIQGIPEFLGWESSFAYRMQFVEGEPLSKLYLAHDSSLLNQMAGIIGQMHDRGVTHNDLRLKNMIVTPENKLYLIDFGAVYYRPEERNPLSWPGRKCFEFLTNTDNAKLARLKAVYRPADITPLERDLITQTGFVRSTTQWWKKRVLPIISPSKHRSK